MNRICGVFKLRDGDLSKIIEQERINVTFSTRDLFFVAERISDTERNRKEYIYDGEIGVVIIFIGELKNFHELCEDYFSLIKKLEA